MSAREKIRILFTDVGNHYQTRGKATFELHDLHDVHAYYRLSNEPKRVIHVQGYPGFSSEEEAWVWARLMDYDKMMALRSRGHSIGNEHGAFVQSFPDFQTDIQILYDAAVLRAKLEENVEALRE